MQEMPYVHCPCDAQVLVTRTANGWRVGASFCLLAPNSRRRRKRKVASFGDRAQLMIGMELYEAVSAPQEEAGAAA